MGWLGSWLCGQLCPASGLTNKSPSQQQVGDRLQADGGERGPARRVLGADDAGADGIDDQKAGGQAKDRCNLSSSD